MIYLDYNASAPLKPAVVTAMGEAMGRFGNPSSVHHFGRQARSHIENARTSVAALANVKPTQVIFTSGGTEANNLIMRHAATVAKIAISAIEHESILACVPDAIKLRVDTHGVIDLTHAEETLKSLPTHSWLSVMMVNNETGVIQPVAEIAKLAKQYGHFIHTDAIQAAGRLAIDFNALGVDAMTLSAHKIGGPQGCGALIVSEKLPLQAMIKGGGQEMNRRPGTENVIGIIGFGVAARLAAEDLQSVSRITAWRDRLQEQLKTIAGEHCLIAGATAPRVGNTLCIAMRGVSSETQVMAMDLAGVAVSAGSACSSGKVKISHVLHAMGYDSDVAGSTLRITLGWQTTEEDIAHCVKAWSALYQRTRRNQQTEAA